MSYERKIKNKSLFFHMIKIRPITPSGIPKRVRSFVLFVITYPMWDETVRQPDNLILKA